jgi:hypothetical protein
MRDGSASARVWGHSISGQELLTQPADCPSRPPEGHAYRGVRLFATCRASLADALPAREEGIPVPAPDDSAGAATLGSVTWDVDDGQLSWSMRASSSLNVRPDDARRGLLGLEGCLPSRDRPRIAAERARVARDATSCRLRITVHSRDGFGDELTEFGWLRLIRDAQRQCGSATPPSGRPRHSGRWSHG